MSCYHIFFKKKKPSIEVYLRVLTTVVKPWIDTVAARRPYIFLQDDALAHTSHLVQNWLSDNMDMFSIFLGHVWSKEFWPPNSPDLNPLDYYVWSIIERVTNKSRYPNVTSLQTAIEAAFVNMDKDALQRVCQRFRPRIEAVIEAKDGYINGGPCTWCICDKRKFVYLDDFCIVSSVHLICDYLIRYTYICYIPITRHH